MGPGQSQGRRGCESSRPRPMELRVPYLLAGTPNSLHSVPARPYPGGDDPSPFWTAWRRGYRGGGVHRGPHLEDCPQAPALPNLQGERGQRRCRKRRPYLGSPACRPSPHAQAPRATPPHLEGSCRSSPAASRTARPPTARRPGRALHSPGCRHRHAGSGQNCGKRTEDGGSEWERVLRHEAQAAPVPRTDEQETWTELGSPNLHCTPPPALSFTFLPAQGRERPYLTNLTPLQAPPTPPGPAHPTRPPHPKAIAPAPALAPTGVPTVQADPEPVLLVDLGLRFTSAQPRGWDRRDWRERS